MGEHPSPAGQDDARKPQDDVRGAEADVPDQARGMPDEARDVPDQADEVALMRQVVRMQQRHREGGVDPELAVGDGGGGQ